MNQFCCVPSDVHGRVIRKVRLLRIWLVEAISMFVDVGLLHFVDLSSSVVGILKAREKGCLQHLLVSTC